MRERGEEREVLEMLLRAMNCIASKRLREMQIKCRQGAPILADMHRARAHYVQATGETEKGQSHPKKKKKNQLRWNKTIPNALKIPHQKKKAVSFSAHFSSTYTKKVVSFRKRNQRTRIGKRKPLVPLIPHYPGKKMI